MGFTNSQVRKAGQTLRQWLRTDAAGDDVERALEVLAWYRAAHRYPLANATKSLAGSFAPKGAGPKCRSA